MASTPAFAEDVRRRDEPGDGGDAGSEDVNAADVTWVVGPALFTIGSVGVLVPAATRSWCSCA